MCLLARAQIVKTILAENNDQNGVYHFDPSDKSRRELKIKSSGVIFEAHLPITVYIKKVIAPQKQAA